VEKGYVPLSDQVGQVLLLGGRGVGADFERPRPRRVAGHEPQTEPVEHFGVVNFFARNLDNMLIGRVWGSQQLGLYAKAYQLLTLPIDQINAPITTAAPPRKRRSISATW